MGVQVGVNRRLKQSDLIPGRLIARLIARAFRTTCQHLDHDQQPHSESDDKDHDVVCIEFFLSLSSHGQLGLPHTIQRAVTDEEKQMITSLLLLL